MLVTSHSRPLAGDLPPLEIEGVAVGFIGGFSELHGDESIFVQIAKLPVVRNIAPYEILALRIPGRSFGPQAAGIKPLDGRVANLGPEAFAVDHDDVGVGITLGRRVGAEVTHRTA